VLTELRRGALFLALSLLLALTSGCFEVEDAWVLNPDGSGKVTRTLTLDPRGKAAKDWANLGIKRAKGVDAWADFKSKSLDDGRLEIQATAYFRDLNALDLKLGPQPYWGPADSTGARRIELSDQDPAKATRGGTPDPGSSRRLLKTILRSYRRAKQARFKASLRLPGAVSGASGLTEQGDAWRAEVALEKVYQSLEPLLDDDDFLLKRGRRRLLGPTVNAKVSGGSLSASVTGGKALFDYAGEAAAARAKSDRLLDEIGVDAVKGGRQLRIHAARVTGLTYLRSEAFAPPQLRFMQADFRPHLRVRLRLELNGDPIATEGLELVSATTLGGVQLALPEFKEDHSAESSNDKKSHVDVELLCDYPPRGFRGLKEISGNLRVYISSETREVDLGLQRVAVGESTADNAITEINGTWVTLRCATLEEAEIKAVRFVTESGKRYSIDVLSKNKRETGCELTLKVPRKFDLKRKLRVLVEIHADKALVELPFEVKGIDTTGAAKK
jgi:hypothetical protein